MSAAEIHGPQTIILKIAGIVAQFLTDCEEFDKYAVSMDVKGVTLEQAKGAFDEPPRQ